jgi:hypothetical protein
VTATVAVGHWYAAVDGGMVHGDASLKAMQQHLSYSVKNSAFAMLVLKPSHTMSAHVGATLERCAGKELC